MPTKYSVTALDRRPTHPNCHRARRSWPSGQEVIIEVLDQDNDPMLTKERSGEAPLTYPDPLRLGRISFAQLQADKMLVIRAADVDAERKDLLQTAADARARATAAEVEVASLKAEVARYAAEKVSLDKKHGAEVLALKANVADLEAQLDVAKTEAAELKAATATQAGEIERLNAKVADLDEQLDEATSPGALPGPDHSTAPSVEIDLDRRATPEEIAHAKANRPKRK